MNALEDRPNVAPVMLLLFLAPFVGEWLLGNQRLSDLHFLPFMALLYGRGAVLIRKRRAAQAEAMPPCSVWG